MSDTKKLIAFGLRFLSAVFLQEFRAVLGNIGGQANYDLQVEDLNGFCPLAGYDEFDASIDKRSQGKACYKYTWKPEPCTMEKSGRIESDLLHCGYYSMDPCTSSGDTGRGSDSSGLFGFDLPWREVKDLCDPVNIKGRTKKARKVKPMYWKWTFCEKEMGTELRPCGHYSMALYQDDPWKHA